MSKRQRLPVIALVGRPNVGKSRLFNRFVGSRKAIVENTPGVTRDRNYGTGKWNSRPFTIIDTGGFEPDSTKQIMGKGDPFYQATFLLSPENPSVARIKKAISDVALSYFDERMARSILAKGERIPLKKGDDKPNPPAGYDGMLYLSAKSKQMPDLRDANPKKRLTDPDEIRSKFVPGYRVNGYVDIFPYEYREGNAIAARGISAGLVSAQFVRRDETFGGTNAIADDAYPDCSENNSAGYADEDLPF